MVEGAGLGRPKDIRIRSTGRNDPSLALLSFLLLRRDTIGVENKENGEESDSDWRSGDAGEVSGALPHLAAD
jgi:hypothetical protein